MNDWKTYARWFQRNKKGEDIENEYMVRFFSSYHLKCVNIAQRVIFTNPLRLFPLSSHHPSLRISVSHHRSVYFEINPVRYQSAPNHLAMASSTNQTPSATFGLLSVKIRYSTHNSLYNLWSLYKTIGNNKPDAKIFIFKAKDWPVKKHPIIKAYLKRKAIQLVCAGKPVNGLQALILENEEILEYVSLPSN